MKLKISATRTPKSWLSAFTDVSNQFLEIRANAFIFLNQTYTPLLRDLAILTGSITLQKTSNESLDLIYAALEITQQLRVDAHGFIIALDELLGTMQHPPFNLARTRDRKHYDAIVEFRDTFTGLHTICGNTMDTLASLKSMYERKLDSSTATPPDID